MMHGAVEQKHIVMQLFLEGRLKKRRRRNRSYVQALPAVGGELAHDSSLTKPSGLPSVSISESNWASKSSYRPSISSRPRLSFACSEVICLPAGGQYRNV